jgi:negative regulator of sigma-B (phosphoserine phosphatase)
MSDEWPAALERGAAGAPHEGERRSGDLAVFAPTPAGGLACVIDGLGHGEEAADAAEIAGRVVQAHPSLSPQDLLERCHAALRRTRGVVMTLAWLDVEQGVLEWTGVGNVEGRLVRAGAGDDARHESALVFAGVVGYTLPRIKPTRARLEPGDAVVLVTDGIGRTFYSTLSGGVGAQALAERIYARHRRGTDDALAVVVRYAP